MLIIVISSRRILAVTSGLSLNICSIMAWQTLGIFCSYFVFRVFCDDGDVCSHDICNIVVMHFSLALGSILVSSNSAQSALFVSLMLSRFVMISLIDVMVSSIFMLCVVFPSVFFSFSSSSNMGCVCFLSLSGIFLVVVVEGVCVLACAFGVSVIVGVVVLFRAGRTNPTCRFLIRVLLVVCFEILVVVLCVSPRYLLVGVVLVV